MKIEFENIRWKNFLSTGNYFTELQLNTNRTTLIVGDNGSGKSTLLDALSFLLYGKPFRNINKPQLINSINQKHALVEGNFRIGPNRYFIRRGMKPNIFEVFLNDKLLNQDAASRDYQEVLEKHILRLNHKSFCQVVILGSASFVPFMKLVAAQRREIIEDLLDLGIFSIMNNLNKTNAETNSNQTRDVENEIWRLEEKIKMQEEHSESLRRSNEEMIAQKQKLIGEAEEFIETYEDRIDDMQKQIDEAHKNISDQTKVTKDLEKGKKIEVSLENKIEKLRNEIKFFSDTDVCPTCNQSIEDHFRKKTVDLKCEEVKTVEDGASKLKELLTEYSARIAEINETVSLVNKLTTEIAVNNNSIRGLRKSIDQMRKEIDTLSKANANIVSKDNVDALTHELESLETSKAALVLKSTIIKDASIILKDSGIKARFIKQYVPIINKLINKYLTAMEFFVQFELDETFNEKIKSRHRDEFSYSSFSEGEKMRINLAILFAWRTLAKMRNSAATNLLIMDEVFDSSLDTSGTDEFMKILNNLTADTNTFIISHKGDALQDKFENTIVFEKYKDFSRISS